MPHLFTSRPRQYTLFPEKKFGISPFYWELINAILYIVGGIIFMVGSIFFLPKYEKWFDVGVWTFFIGSLVYLIITSQDFLESSHYLRSKLLLTQWDWLEFIAANFYIIGTILFTVGSLFFLSQIEQFILGSWSFIIGSLLFLIGACINIIESIQESSLMELQLLNLTAIMYALGSVLFLVASIPYLWQPLDLEQPWQQLVFSYVGWEYIVGSLFFLAGGIINYYRLYQSSKFQQLSIDYSP